MVKDDAMTDGSLTRYYLVADAPPSSRYSFYKDKRHASDSSACSAKTPPPSQCRGIITNLAWGGCLFCSSFFFFFCSFTMTTVTLLLTYLTLLALLLHYLYIQWRQSEEFFKGFGFSIAEDYLCYQLNLYLS